MERIPVRSLECPG